jgi:dsRNA-specific ribonuclease
MGNGVGHVTAPKVLADVLEGIVGAVFLDSGLDLAKVWEVFEPWFRGVIDVYSANIPANPVKFVVEKFRAKFRFEQFRSKLQLWVQRLSIFSDS